MTAVPDLRIRAVNDAPARRASYVVYWMIAARRSRSNFALDRALEHARALGCGLLVLEPLRVDYPWASTRFHQFVIDGMADNARAFDVPGVTYLPYVEPRPEAGKGLLEALAAEASVVVTDEFPCAFLPRMVDAAGRRLPVRLEAVDGNGLLPLAAASQAFPTAYAFRRHLHRTLADHLAATPAPEPLAGGLPTARPALPASVEARWPAWTTGPSAAEALRRLPIDQDVRPAAGVAGGPRAAAERLRRFLADGLPRYVDERNDPDTDVTSGLSPYLHFGHVSAHEVFRDVMRREGWLGTLPATGRGERAGWWGVSPAAEGFLDQLVTWRELGFNMCARRADYDQYTSLPSWAQATLARHATDARDPAYSLAALDAAATYDPLWNAAQRQLRDEGRMHNYLRMLWGKKILQWSATPQDALSAMIALNNRYALDGRDPNSYSGIFWTLGRYDRPWGPEREIFGTVRYMSSENTARKVHVRRYLERYGPQSALDL